MVNFRSLALFTLVAPLALGAVISPREPTPVGGRGSYHKTEHDPLAAIGISSNKLTNAQRLARGLGPLPPTRRMTAAKAKRSGSPGVASTQGAEEDIFLGPIVIRLRKGRGGDAVDVGVVTLPDSGLANFDPNASRAQKFTRKGAGGSGPFAMSPVGGATDGVTPLLSVIVGNGAPLLSPGTANYVPLGLGKEDPSGLINIDLPLGLLGGGDQGPGQSAIWTLGPNNELFAHYANPDGSSSPVFLVTGGPCQHLICLSADINVFRQTFGDDAYDLHAFATVL